MIAIMARQGEAEEDKDLVQEVHGLDKTQPWWEEVEDGGIGGQG